MDRLPKHLYFSEGGENDVETLFVLESPYKDELYWEFPCMGVTGKKMSDVLMQKSDIALGDLIRENCSLTRKYALFETFKFPLDKSLTHGLDTDELFWKKIKEIKNRVQIENFFSQNISYFAGSYKKNFEYGISLFQNNLKTIVVCGDIAQVIFEEIFKEKLVSIGQFVGEEVRTLDVVFTEHPAKAAYENRCWNYQPATLVKYKFML